MIDLHMHSTCSDGKDTIEELINNVNNAGIKFFSITDHDTAESGRRIFKNSNLQQLICEKGLKYVTGMEVTCRYNGHKMHILAYDFDPFAQEVFEVEQDMKKLLKEKEIEKLRLLSENGYSLSQKSLDYLATRINVRTLDIANCLINDGYFDDIETAAAYVSRGLKTQVKARLDGKEIVEKLSKIGAKMVWAHPIYGIGDRHESFEDVEKICQELKPYGLIGLECFYSLYNKEEIENLLNIAERLEMNISCGSDYHGKNKTVGLAEFSSDGTQADFSKVNIIDKFENVIGK